MTNVKSVSRDAGRELDVLVAEKVFGCIVSTTYPATLLRIPVCTAHKTHRTIRPYSTDIAAAWEVAEKIGDMAMAKRHVRDGSGRSHYAVYFELERNTTEPRPEAPWHYAESAAHAICLAALKAVEVRPTTAETPQ